MKRLILFVSLFISLSFLSGCVIYRYKNIETDGSACTLTIKSMREMHMAGLIIGKECELMGGGTGITYNDEAMLAIKDLVGKIP